MVCGGLFRLRALVLLAVGLFCAHSVYWIVTNTDRDISGRLPASASSGLHPNGQTSTGVIGTYRYFAAQVASEQTLQPQSVGTLSAAIVVKGQPSHNAVAGPQQGAHGAPQQAIHNSLGHEVPVDSGKAIQKPAHAPPIGKSSWAIRQQIPVPWGDFVHMVQPTFAMSTNDTHWYYNRKQNQRPLRNCDASAMQNLSKPIMSNKDLHWCRHAFKELHVMPGENWGDLTGDLEGRLKFDRLNCNAVYVAANATCDDSWGDASVRGWEHKEFGPPCGNLNGDAKSNNTLIKCKQSKSGMNAYCKLKHVMINFNQRIGTNGGLDGRPFEQNFISTSCPGGAVNNLFPIPHSIYSYELSSQACDVVLNEVVILTTHENIYNLAHTMNDIMNIWYIMWLEGISQHASQISLLNIDRLKPTGDHEFNDTFSPFFEIYKRSFRHVYRGRSFDGNALCVKELLVPTRPAKQFVFEGWISDLPCTYAGPSSLYQRWSMDVRNNFQLLPGQNRQRDNSIFQVLLIIRNATLNNWAGQRTSRNFLNTAEIVESIQQLLSTLSPGGSIKEFKLIAVDVSDLPFTQQIELVNHSNLVVGMHGAGITLSLFMSIGSPHCCGLLELFPEGDHKKIRGFGNMARKAGVRYDRMDIEANLSTLNGALVPVKELQSKIEDMVDLLSSSKGTSCLHTALLVKADLGNSFNQ